MQCSRNAGRHKQIPSFIVIRFVLFSASPLPFPTVPFFPFVFVVLFVIVHSHYPSRLRVCGRARSISWNYRERRRGDTLLLARKCTGNDYEVILYFLAANLLPLSLPWHTSIMLFTCNPARTYDYLTYSVKIDIHNANDDVNERYVLYRRFCWLYPMQLLRDYRFCHCGLK